MERILPVSVVIPIREAQEDSINRLAQAILDQTAWPAEIVLVNAGSEDSRLLDDSFRNKFDDSVKIKVFFSKAAYPGKARNLGVANASQPFLSFLDLMTVPNSTWLEKYYERISQNDCDGIIGCCRFIGETFFSWILIDSLFGRGKVSTLPGSIFTRAALDRVGPMIEKTRSGEDNEWFQRAELMDVRLVNYYNGTACNYLGYSKTTFSDFCKKWARNYWHAAGLPQYKLLQQFNLSLWIIAATSFAFNWNALFAEWEDSHPMYIPHVTKATIGFLLLLYLFLRGVYLPVSRGSPLRKILSFRLFFVLCVVFLADLIKSICFITSTFRKRKDFDSSQFR